MFWKIPAEMNHALCLWGISTKGANFDVYCPLSLFNDIIKRCLHVHQRMKLLCLTVCCHTITVSYQDKQTGWERWGLPWHKTTRCRVSDNYRQTPGSQTDMSCLPRVSGHSVGVIQQTVSRGWSANTRQKLKHACYRPGTINNVTRV